MKEIANGVWPTMITPFTEDGKIDYAMVEKLVEWYIERGVAGIFAVCQSSEMFFLTAEERVELAAFIVKKVNGRVGVVASGHCADDLDEQIAGIEAMAKTGVDNVVLLPNRFAKADEGDDVLLKNLKYVLDRVSPEISFGFYECPYPYKRVLTPEVISFCADTGRFTFMKDTCCDADLINAKIRAGKGVIKLFNANCAQLLQTLRAGASGFSGVMANFHPEAYAWLCKNYEAQPELAEKLQDYLGVVSAIEGRQYPVCAKKYIKTFHFPEMSDYTRSSNRDNFVPSFYTEVLSFNALYKAHMACLGLDFGVKL
ncbi:MAG: dihydrodipicolinate synthase family protein [Clostridia bacterium]|nr:dihydrodipicolinate synthase family protein [Clostridia bacterium]